MKFKVTKKGKYTIELVSSTKEKTPLTIGYKKSILFLQVSAKAVGEEVDIDVETSDKTAGYSGNLYATEHNKYKLAMLDAKEYVVRERNINALLAQGTV